MKKSPIELSLQCQKKWETMTPTNGGRFCVDCKKNVTDFSKVSILYLDNLVPANNQAELCGHFRAYQLNKPFGNWRDKIISFYQTVSYKWTANKISKQFMLLLITIALITTGCNRHIRGRVRVKNNRKKHNHAEQTTSDSTETKFNKKMDANL